MRRQNRMSALASDGKAGTLHMTDTLFQDRFAQSMIDCQSGFDLRDLDTPHQTITVRIQNPVIRMTQLISILFLKSIYNGIHRMLGIILLRLFPQPVIVVVRKLRYRFLVLTDQLGISILVPHITDRGIKEHTRPRQKH